MREYSKKEVLWLDSLPSDWKIKPLFTLGFENKKLNKNLSEQNLLSLSYGKVVEKDIKSDDGLLPESFEGYQVVEPGTLIFRFTDLQNDQTSLRSGLVTSRGIITNAYLGFVPTGASPRFLDYLMRALDTNKVFYGMGSGLRQSLTWEDARRIPVLLPDTAEQQDIVHYLDQETSQIDLLISKKEQLIEKLMERRQALITQAVTKGLDSNVPMKDSGVEWIGAMPRDFELDKASRFFKARKGSSAALLSVEYCAAHPGQYPVYSGQTENGGVMAEIDTFEFDFHEKPVLFTTTVGSSKVMSVDLLSGRFSLSQNCMILVPTSEDKLLTKYAFWMLQALFLEKKKELSAHMQLSFRMSDFYGYRLIVPPAETQREVASYLETETKKIEKITSAAISAITLLKERRQALITQVVTGKLDVRGFAGGNS